MEPFQELKVCNIDTCLQIKKINAEKNFKNPNYTFMWDTLYKYRNILQIQQFKTHKLFKRKILFKYLQLRINKFEYASSKLVLYFILFGTRSLLNTRPDRFDRFDVYKIQTSRQTNVLVRDLY